MARTRHDVELRIRAKDDASRALNRIDRALRDVADAQRRLSDGAAASDAALRKMRESLASLGSERPSEGLRLLGQRIREQREAVRAAIDAFGQYSRSLRTVTSALQKSADAHQQAKDAAAALDEQHRAKKKALDGVARELKNASRELDRYTKKTERLSKQQAATAERLAEARKRVNALAREIRKADDPTKSLIRSHEAAVRQFDRTRERLAALKAQYREASAAQQEAATKARLLQMAHAAAADNLSRLAARLEEARRKELQLADATAALAEEQRRLSDLTNAAGRAARQQQAALERTRAEFKAAQAAASEYATAQRRLAGDARSTLLAALDKQQAALNELRVAYKAAEQRMLQFAARASQARGEHKGLDAAMLAASRRVEELRARYAALSKELEAARAAVLRAGDNTTKLANATDRVRQVASRTEAALRELSAAERQLAAGASQATGSVERLRAATDRLADAARRGETATSRFARAWQELTGHSARAVSYYERLRGQILSLVAAYAGFYAIPRAFGSLIDAEKKLVVATQNFQAVVSETNLTLQQQGELFEYVKKTAYETGAPLASLVTNFSRLHLGLRNKEVPIEATADALDKLMRVFAVFGLDTYQIDRALLALTQMGSKGSVAMEELRQQLGDHFPAAVALMAEAAGFGRDEMERFYKAVENKQVGAETILKFSALAWKNWGDQFAAIADKAWIKLGGLKNAWLEFRGVMAEAGINQALSRLFAALSRMLTDPAFLAFSRMLAELVALAIDFVTVLVEHWYVALPFVAVLIGRVVQKLVVFAATLLGLRGIMSGFFGALFGGDGGGGAAGGGGGAGGRRVAMITRLTMALKALGGVIVGIVLTPVRALRAAFSGLVAVLGAVVGAVTRAGAVLLGSLAGGIARLTGSLLPMFASTLGVVARAALGLVAAVAALPGWVVALGAALIGGAAALYSYASSGERAAEAAQATATSMEMAASAAEQAAPAMHAAGAALRRVRVSRANIRSVGDLAENLDAASEAADRGVNLEVSGQAEAEDLGQSVRGLSEATQEVRPAAEEARDAFGGMAEGLADASGAASQSRYDLDDNIRSVENAARAARDAAEAYRDMAATMREAGEANTTPGGAVLASPAGDAGAGGPTTVGGFADWVASFFHDGGVVGRNGRQARMPAWLFAGAPRFHEGGLVTLGPKEIPAILEQGEEVLTRADPRHILNGGKYLIDLARLSQDIQRQSVRTYEELQRQLYILRDSQAARNFERIKDLLASGAGAATTGTSSTGTGSASIEDVLAFVSKHRRMPRPSDGLQYFDIDQDELKRRLERVTRRVVGNDVWEIPDLRVMAEPVIVFRTKGFDRRGGWVLSRSAFEEGNYSAARYYANLDDYNARIEAEARAACRRWDAIASSRIVPLGATGPFCIGYSWDAALGLCTCSREVEGAGVRYAGQAARSGRPGGTVARAGGQVPGDGPRPPEPKDTGLPGDDGSDWPDGPDTFPGDEEAADLPGGGPSGPTGLPPYPTESPLPPGGGGGDGGGGGSGDIGDFGSFGADVFSRPAGPSGPAGGSDRPKDCGPCGCIEDVCGQRKGLWDWPWIKCWWRHHACEVKAALAGLWNRMTGGGGEEAYGGGGGGPNIGGAGAAPLVMHSGGIVSSAFARARRGVSAVVAATAEAMPRFHAGGLASDEVPAILQRGEEVLTRDDPRHILNRGPLLLQLARLPAALPAGPSFEGAIPRFHEGGVVGGMMNVADAAMKTALNAMSGPAGGMGAAPRPKVEVKVVNTIDPVSFLSEALGTAEGEEVLLNAIRANAEGVKGGLG